MTSVVYLLNLFYQFFMSLQYSFPLISNRISLKESQRRKSVLYQKGKQTATDFFQVTCCLEKNIISKKILIGQAKILFALAGRAQQTKHLPMSNV